MSSLLWKEWHEQRWKLGFATLVLLCLALIGLRCRLLADERVSQVVCFIGIVMLPIFATSGLLPQERSEGTLESLLALPTRRWNILLAKLLMGALLCVIPLAVAALASVIFAGGREITSLAFVELYVESMLTTLILFAWMLALTARLPSEARAGLLGTGVLILWMLITGGIAEMDSPQLFSLTPFAFVYEESSKMMATPLMAYPIQGAIVAALVYWTYRRFAAEEAAR